MKGFQFFLEYPTSKDKRQGTRKVLGNHSGNVLAIDPDTLRITNDGAVYDAIAAVFYVRNSAVGSTSASSEYLREKCKRISESTARIVHPELFTWLDE
jgi:hypothetical protein